MFRLVNSRGESVVSTDCDCAGAATDEGLTTSTARVIHEEEEVIACFPAPAHDRQDFRPLRLRGGRGVASGRGNLRRGGPDGPTTRNMEEGMPAGHGIPGRMQLPAPCRGHQVPCNRSRTRTVSTSERRPAGLFRLRVTRRVRPDYPLCGSDCTRPGRLPALPPCPSRSRLPEPQARPRTRGLWRPPT